MVALLTAVVPREPARLRDRGFAAPLELKAAVCLQPAELPASLAEAERRPAVAWHQAASEDACTAAAIQAASDTVAVAAYPGDSLPAHNHRAPVAAEQLRVAAP